MHIFLRHCISSNASIGKARPQGFDRQHLLDVLAATLTNKDKCTLVLDLGSTTATEFNKRHFAEDFAIANNWKVVKGSYGSEGKAFQAILDIVRDMKGDDDYDEDEVITILEDDYLVAKNWQQAILEGLCIADYVTLYDHPDKYSAMYAGLVSKVFKTHSCHWRTTPSTTNSFATTAKTLRKDKDIHVAYSTGLKVTQDHFKFLELWKQARPLETLISSMPSFWSHEEEGMQS